MVGDGGGVGYVEFVVRAMCVMCDVNHKTGRADSSKQANQKFLRFLTNNN